MSEATTSVVAPLALGTVFGVALQRARLGRCETVVNVFRFVDFTVVKFLLSALMVSMVMIQALVSLGFSDGAPVAQTFALGNLVGGSLFGVGLALVGFCPGTVAAGAGEGRLDNLVPGGARPLRRRGVLRVGVPAVPSRALSRRPPRRGDHGAVAPRLPVVADRAPLRLRLVDALRARAPRASTSDAPWRAAEHLDIVSVRRTPRGTLVAERGTPSTETGRSHPVDGTDQLTSFGHRWQSNRMEMRRSSVRWRSAMVCAWRVSVGLTLFAAGCAPVGPDDLATVEQGIDITVSPGGSIAAAINRANPGDRILVRAGTYAGGGWIERSGTAAAPITVLSVDGPRRAIISGGAEPLRVGSSAYLVFDGFEVRGAGNNAVHVDASHHVTLRNLYAHDAGADGDAVKVNQSHHITIESSELARPGARTASGVNPYQECLDLLDVDDAVVRNNFIHDGGGQLMVVKGGSRNAVIEGNLISQQRAGSTDPAVGLGGWTDADLLGGERYEAINIVFRNNVVMGGAYGAIAVYDVQGGYIAHNLLINNDRVLVDFRAGNGPAGGSSDVRVMNNLMVDSRGRMPTAYLRSSHTATGFAATYNLFWNNGAAIPTGGLLNPAAQAGHLAVNPLITAPAAAATRDAVVTGARPSATSPAKSSATDATVAPFLVTADIAGVARGAGRDRGPWALSSTAPAPTPTPTPTPTPAATVRYTVAPTAGTVGVASTITASSANVTSPRYRFWLVSPGGVWTMPCGDYAARATCAFTPNAAGTWQVAVSVRAATSTAQYDATTNEAPYTVAAAASNRCPEAVRADGNGDPRNAAGQIRYCWPSMANCYCDSDNDCYPLSGYVACTPI